MKRLALAIELDKLLVFRRDLFQPQGGGQGHRPLGRGYGRRKVTRLGLRGGQRADEQRLGVAGQFAGARR
jgi:hypothetical protein